MNKELSLFQICQDATQQAISNGVGETGFSINEVLRIVRTQTKAAAYPREWLFDQIVKNYVAICANAAGYRSVQKRSCVYVNEDINHEGARLLMIENARGDALARNNKADDMQEAYELRFSKNGMTGQLGFDVETGNWYQEMDANDLIKAIRAFEEDRGVHQEEAG